MSVRCEGVDCSVDFSGSFRVKVKHGLKGVAGSEPA